ncbi:hypothetical protein HDU84_003954 [Entophlyctis sp. JEL0112]|nr:hypothetical protein HDU84_003954 [Entophlyctis sp. JEL0112]
MSGHAVAAANALAGAGAGMNISMNMGKGVSLSSSLGVARGALIVLEGVDRSGKSSQCAALARALPSGCAVWRFPDRATATGKLIDAYLSQPASEAAPTLDDRTIHLLFAANRAESMSKLRDTLMRGISVVVDRYAFSGVAYTLAKANPSLDKKWCMSVDSGILKPDVVVFLDIPPADAALRGDYGRERYEKRDFQEKVRECFMQMVDNSYWKVLDARKPVEELAGEILRIANVCLDECGDRPLQLLWKDS